MKKTYYDPQLQVIPFCDVIITSDGFGIPVTGKDDFTTGTG